MKPEDVMKALECCLLLQGATCRDCPLLYAKNMKGTCYTELKRQALALLREKDAEIADVKETYKIQREATNRLLKRVGDQDSEIDRLTHICRCYALRYGTVRDQSDAIAKIRAEILAEYIERAKKRLPVISPSVFEQIAKELESCTKN